MTLHEPKCLSITPTSRSWSHPTSAVYYLAEVPDDLPRRGTLERFNCAMRKCRSITLSVEKETKFACAILHRDSKKFSQVRDFAGCAWPIGHRNYWSTAIRRFRSEKQNVEFAKAWGRNSVTLRRVALSLLKQEKDSQSVE